MPINPDRPRGFAAIALDNPKFNVNVGSALRAAQCFGAALIVIGGTAQRYKRSSTDTTKAYRHIPLLHAPDIFAAVPFDCVPVAVDLVEGAVPLPDYRHPERAFYIFGAEDATLGRRITDRCRDRVYVPMVAGCLNLAMCVNVVLYDRMSKQAGGPRLGWPGNLTIGRPAGETPAAGEPAATLGGLDPLPTIGG